ncbi:MAG: hypothetical protein M1497_09105 [Nitrospirae bacterium]|nr:hypothetical protein [Nitrospirota bacterium]
MKQKGSWRRVDRLFIALAVLVLLLAGGWFFWFQYRPSMVRARCAAEAEKRADKDEFVYEIIYRHCLRKCGIEYTGQKEDKN